MRTKWVFILMIYCMLCGITNVNIAYAFPKGKFYMINIVGCNHVFTFSKETFKERESCDMGPINGFGKYKYLPKDSMLILYYETYVPEPPPDAPIRGCPIASK